MIGKKKIAAAVLAAAMLITTPSVFAASYTDTEGHWAEQVIEKWNDRGAVNGYEDGAFRPDNSITRAETAAILCRIGSYSETASNTFTDLPNDAWYADSILKLNAAGIMSGDGSTVRPNDYITREEALAMLARAYTVTGSKALDFADSNEVSDWAVTYAEAMYANSLVKGSDGKLRPKANITRAEILQLLENLSGYTPQDNPTQNPTDGNKDDKTEQKPDTKADSSKNEEILDSDWIGGGGSSGGSSGSSGTTGGKGDKSDIKSDDASVGSEDEDVGGIW